MEDGVEAIEDLVKNREDMSADQEREEKIQQGNDGEEEGKSSGVVKSLISALVSRGREGEEGEGKSEDGRASDPADDASGDGDGGGGGIINSFISNIFHQSEGGDGESAENGGENEQVKDAEEGEGGGGGIINSLISNIFHQSDEAGDGGERAENGGENEQVKGTEEGGGGSSSSVLDNIVSHLPKPLSGINGRTYVISDLRVSICVFC